MRPKRFWILSAKFRPVERIYRSKARATGMVELEIVMRDVTAHPNQRTASPTLRPHATRRLRAFSLIELLVVVGIIALLISILLPVLRRAREQARTIACASNQRQILQSFYMYAQDNKGSLPVALGNHVGQGFYHRFAYCAILMDAVGHYDYSTPGALLPYIARDAQTRERIFTCPSDGPERFAGMSLPPVPDTTRPRNFSYNFNGWLVAGLKLTQVRRPANKILLLEEQMPSGDADQVSTIGPADATGHSSYTLLTTRHGGDANAGFADQHVELIDPKVFYNPLATGGRGTVYTDAYAHYYDVLADR